MAEQYFDIETYSPGEKPNPETDKIISIQFQRIDLRTGKPLENPTILKEWESSEEDIVKQFFNKFFFEGSSPWNFVAVGYNLNFEWEFLINKFKKYLNKDFSSRDIHYSRPHVDIKHLIVLLNNGNFAGAKLNNFTNKKTDGKGIKDLYESKNYAEIENYINNETESFLEFLQKINKNIKRILE